MPQIPIYNRGQGPTVQMTTGTLGPKLSSQVFERAAAAQKQSLRLLNAT
jgi:hypothetical protein